MLYLIIYDITEDKIRYRISQIIMDWGGERIQYSAFKIELEPEELNNLLLKLKTIIGHTRGRITAVPICAKDFEKIITLINNYNLPRKNIIL